jgi:hypothetical protein
MYLGVAKNSACASLVRILNSAEHVAAHLTSALMLNRLVVMGIHGM